MENVHIESNRLSIKPFIPEDADAIFPCITTSITRFMSWEPPTTREDFDLVWRTWLPSIADGSDYTFVIRQHSNGQFLGVAGLHDVRSDRPELGIWIREDSHGKGFGREAVRLIAQWATRNLGIRHFLYPVAEENHASRGIAESLGGVIVERRSAPKYDSVVYLIPGQTDFQEA